VPREDDWFQRPVLDLVNKAMKAGKAREQFIPLPLRDQTIALVLVPPALFKKAVRAGLIPRQGLVGGEVQEEKRCQEPFREIRMKRFLTPFLFPWSVYPDAAVGDTLTAATYPGAQTERRGGAGPVGGLLGGKDLTGRFRN
jgi:hypothetical protein